MIDEYIKDLMGQYSKSEIVDLCGELDMTVSDTLKFSDVLIALVDDLEEEGIPHEEDMSEEMKDFLYTAGFIDEDGDMIDIDDDEEEEEEEEREAKVVPKAVVQKEDSDRLPECFGFHDDRDPACRKCKVKVSCEDERLKNRPECFGELYQKKNVQCEQCIERTFCKEAMK